MDIGFELFIAEKLNELNKGLNDFWKLDERTLWKKIYETRVGMSTLTEMLIEDVKKNMGK